MKKAFWFALLLALLLAAVPAAAEEMSWETHWIELGMPLGEPDGQLEEDTGVRNYIDSDTGTTSAIIGEKTGKSTVTWVKEEADGMSTWFGLDDGFDSLEEGSRFYVRWLSRKQNPTQWNNYYSRIDDEHKLAVEGDHLWIFQIGVTGPDGSEYTELKQDLPLYVQIADDWDVRNLHAVYIADGVDEAKLVAHAENLVYPEGTDDFAALTISHFSPYAIYAVQSMVSDGGVAGPVGDDLPQTGDESRMGLWLVLLALSGAAGIALLLRRRAYR